MYIYIQYTHSHEDANEPETLIQNQKHLSQNFILGLVWHIFLYNVGKETVALGWVALDEWHLNRKCKIHGSVVKKFQ